MIEAMRRGTPVEVDRLDADWVLDLARDAELMARQADRAKLRAANRWADLHVATAESGVEVWGNAGALDCDVPIGGEGTPSLAAFSVEPFGAALGISTLSAMNLISAAVELKHRLPGLWALSERLEVPGWKTRLAARLTSGLSAEAAAYVDEQLAPVLATRGGPTIARVGRRGDREVPPRAGGRGRTGRPAAWDVRVTHPGPGEWAGTSWLDATADTMDLTKFGDLIADIARRLGEAGDPDPWSSAGPRRSASSPTCTPAPTSTTSLLPSSRHPRTRSRRRVGRCGCRGSGPGTCSSTSTWPRRTWRAASPPWSTWVR